jgi:hypothetical protein
MPHTFTLPSRPAQQGRLNDKTRFETYSNMTKGVVCLRIHFLLSNMPQTFTLPSRPAQEGRDWGKTHTVFKVNLGAVGLQGSQREPSTVG